VEESEEPAEEAVEVELGPLEQIQAVLCDLDPDAMVTGFAVTVEWLEPDGSRALQLLHTGMASWHLTGMLQYIIDHHAGQMYEGPAFEPVFRPWEEGDEEDDDEFDED
jgi:hypothetical protein